MLLNIFSLSRPSGTVETTNACLDDFWDFENLHKKYFTNLTKVEWIRNKNRIMTKSPLFNATFLNVMWWLDSLQDCFKNLGIQLEDQIWSLINPIYLFFPKLLPKFSTELLKIGHFQNSGSIFGVKYSLNFSENDFLLRIVD